MSKPKNTRGGGRVTPKGTKPPERGRKRGAPKGSDDDNDNDNPEPEQQSPVPREDPGWSRHETGPRGPVRSGHHRGQR